MAKSPQVASHLPDGQRPQDITLIYRPNSVLSAIYMSNIFSCRPAANTRAFTTQPHEFGESSFVNLKYVKDIGHAYDRKQATVPIACHRGVGTYEGNGLKLVIRLVIFFIIP